MAKGSTRTRGIDDTQTNDLLDDHGVDDPATHDVGDDHGVDDPLTHDVGDDHGVDDPATHDVGDDRGVDDPLTHDIGDDRGVDDPTTHDVGDDHGVDDPATHDVGDDQGVDDPATHDVGDDHGVDDPLTHDIGDDHGNDDPLTHDVGDDHGVDDPATHDVGDDHGGRDTLCLFVNKSTGQMVFTADSIEFTDWAGDDGKQSLDVSVSVPTDDTQSTAVWRFHDPKSDVYFWTADDKVKESILHDLPQVEFEGEAFRAYHDQASGGHLAIGLVWDRDSGGDYGKFVYAPVDDAIALAGQSTTDGIDYLGVSFWI